jgi:tetratricopeptide (TPR) repeat protein
MKRKICFLFFSGFLLAYTALAQVNPYFIVKVDTITYTNHCRLKLYFPDGSFRFFPITNPPDYFLDCNMVSDIQILPLEDLMSTYKYPEPIPCMYYSILKPPIRIHFSSNFRPGSLHSFDELVDTTGIKLFLKSPKIDPYVMDVCDKLKLTTLADKLIIIGANIPTFAEYRKVEGENVFCYLLYNQQLLDSLTSLTNINSAKYIIDGILLHEIGHLQNQHGKNINEKSNITMELEADLFAGRWLHEFNADSNQVIEMLKLVRNPQGSDNYPSLDERRRKLLDGWLIEENHRLNAILHQSDAQFKVIDSIRNTFFQKGDYISTARLLDSINTLVGAAISDSNKLMITRLLGESYYKLGPSDPNIYYAWALQQFDKYLAEQEDGDIFFKNGEAYYYLRKYDTAFTNFRHSLEYNNETVREGNIFYYLGSCLKEKKDYTGSLSYFNKSLEKDLSNPFAFEKRGEVRNILQRDSLILILDDYHSAFRIITKSQDSLRVASKINDMSDAAYYKALSVSHTNPEWGIQLLKYLKRTSTEKTYKDVNFEIAGCYQIIYDTTHVHSTLDSIIRYLTFQLSFSPSDYRAWLIRGKTYAIRYNSGKRTSDLDSASNDLKRIPDTAAEYYEASFYKIRFDIMRADYCDILNRYNTIKDAYWHFQTKREICNIINIIAKQKCIKGKQRKLMKKNCRN